MKPHRLSPLVATIAVPLVLVACADTEPPNPTTTTQATTVAPRPTLPMRIGERTHHVTDHGEEYSTIEHITVGGSCAESSDVNGTPETSEVEGKKLVQVWATREVVSRKLDTASIWHPQYLRPGGKPEQATLAPCYPPAGYERWSTYVPAGESEQIYAAQWIPDDADRLLFGGDRVVHLNNTEPHPDL